MSDINEFIAAAEKVKGIEITNKPEISKSEVSTAESEIVIEPTETTGESAKSDFKYNFETLTRQDKMNRDNRKALETQRKEFEADKKELEQYRAFDRQLKDDPMGILEKLGLSYDRIQQLQKERTENLDPKVLEARLREKIQADYEEKDRQKQLEIEHLENVKFESEISETVLKGEFDFISTFNAESSVRDFILEYYKETGNSLTIEEGCRIVNDELIEKYNKLKSSRWLSQISVPEITKSESKTLSNKMTQKSSVPKSPKFMTEDERVQAAMALF